MVFLARTVWELKFEMGCLEFPHLELLPPCQDDVLLYAHSMDLSEDVLYNKESFISNDDFAR